MQSHRSRIVTLFFAMLLAGIGQAAAEATRPEISDRRIFGRFRMGEFVILERRVQRNAQEARAQGARQRNLYGRGRLQAGVVRVVCDTNMLVLERFEGIAILTPRAFVELVDHG